MTQKERVEAIIEAINETPWIDSEELAESMGVTRSTVSCALSKAGLLYKDLKRAAIMDWVDKAKKLAKQQTQIN